MTKFILTKLLVVIATVQLLGSAVCRADTLYYSNAGNKVVKLNLATNNPVVFGNSGLDFPMGIAFDSAGNLCAINYDNSNIEKFSPNGVGSVFVDTRHTSWSGLAIDGAGNLYAANPEGNFIEKFSSDGVDLGVFASTGLNYPVGLSFDSAGNLYAANYGNNTIEKFTPGGVASTFATTGLNGPWCIAFNSAGNLYAVNRGNNTVEQFATDGTDLGMFASTGLNAPRGLAFDSAGNLYVGNYGNNTIEKFTPSGVGSLYVTLGIGFGFPQFFAIQVPALKISMFGDIPGLEVFGPSGTTNSLQFVDTLSSTNTWNVITNVILTPSPALILDYSATNVPTRFYRTIQIHD